MDMHRDLHYLELLWNVDMHERQRMEVEYSEMDHDMYKILDDKQHMVLDDKKAEVDDE